MMIILDSVKLNSLVDTNVLKNTEQIIELASWGDIYIHHK